MYGVPYRERSQPRTPRPRPQALVGDPMVYDAAGGGYWYLPGATGIAAKSIHEVIEKPPLQVTFGAHSHPVRCALPVCTAHLHCPS